MWVKPSATGQPTQPFILSGSINEYGKTLPFTDLAFSHAVTHLVSFASLHRVAISTIPFNFSRHCRPIFKIISPSDSQENTLCTCGHFSGGFRGRGCGRTPLASFRKIQGLPISKIVRTADSTIIIIITIFLPCS